MNIDISNFDETINLLREADDLYFNSGETILSDSEYDRIKRAAYNINRNHPYFMKVGSDVRGGKVKLPYPMYGLEQVYEGEITSWVEKNGFNKEDIVITHKLDGVSCMLVYADRDMDNEAEFVIAYSRGNSMEGADITRNLRHISIPQSITDTEFLVVRGELIVKKKVFEEKYSKMYSTARAMVAGCMNRKETDPDVLKDIDFVAYTIMSTDIPKIDAMAHLRQCGFEIPFTQVAKPKSLSDEFLHDIIKVSKDISDYELDGIVLTENDNNDSIKYKILDEDTIRESKVKKIHWEISKSGFFKPRVEIQPVNINGVIITFATGFNAKFIQDNKLGPGAVVRITRSGDVIPYILDVLHPAEEPQMPEEEYTWNETGVDATVMDLDSHPDVKFRQVLDFFESIKVDLLKESTLKTVMDTLNISESSYDEILETIFDLTEAEWKMMVGVNGVKINNSLHRRLRNMKLETLLGSLKYCGFGFGIRRAKQLLSQIDVRDVWDLTVEQIDDLHGFDVKTAQRVAEGLALTKDFLERNKDYIILNEVDKTDELQGLTFVFTGFRDNALEERIEAMGGKVTSGVSKKTSYLVSAEGDSGSGKCKKAKQYDIPILNLEEFKDKFNL